jgi:hypothetical protein
VHLLTSGSAGCLNAQVTNQAVRASVHALLSKRSSSLWNIQSLRVSKNEFVYNGPSSPAGPSDQLMSTVCPQCSCDVPFEKVNDVFVHQSTAVFRQLGELCATRASCRMSSVDSSGWSLA